MQSTVKVGSVKNIRETWPSIVTRTLFDIIWKVLQGIVFGLVVLLHCGDQFSIQQHFSLKATFVLFQPTLQPKQ